MVFEKVRTILSNQFDVEEGAITLETNIADDLLCCLGPAITRILYYKVFPRLSMTCHDYFAGGGFPCAAFPARRGGRTHPHRE